jgi:hypothetical protein
MTITLAAVAGLVIGIALGAIIAGFADGTPPALGGLYSLA